MNVTLISLEALICKYFLYGTISCLTKFLLHNENVFVIRLHSKSNT